MKGHLFALIVSVIAVTPALSQTAMQAPPTAPVSAQGAAAPDASALTDKEQKKLKQCKAMTYIQQQQSSKCVEVMKKAGVTSTAPQQPRD